MSVLTKENVLANIDNVVVFTGEDISMTRRKVTATELKNHLGAYLEAAVAAPVFVEKSGREVAVLISHEHYTYLQALEDRWWGEQATLAEQRGFLGVEATARALAALQPQEDEDTC